MKNGAREMSGKVAQRDIRGHASDRDYQTANENPVWFDDSGTRHNRSYSYLPTLFKFYFIQKKEKKKKETL